VEPRQDVGDGIDDRRERRRRAGNVDGGRNPVDRQHRRWRLDVIDLEIARPRDALRRKTHPQAALDLEVRGLLVGEVAGARRAAAQQLGLDLRLDQHIARPLLHRPVLLVFDVGEADSRHFADDDAAILELRSHVEALHRFVEVRLDRQPGLEPAAGADHDDHDDAGDDGAHHEQSQLEVVGFEAHWTTLRTSGCGAIGIGTGRALMAF
jgi:hypothetical protein